MLNNKPEVLNEGFSKSSSYFKFFQKYTPSRQIFGILFKNLPEFIWILLNFVGNKAHYSWIDVNPVNLSRKNTQFSKNIPKTGFNRF